MDTRESSQEALRELAEDYNIPWIYRWAKISHYYGDSVRQIFIAAAVIMLAAAPFYTSDLKAELPFIIIGAVALVGAAGLTSPLKIGAIRIDAVIAGAGLVIFELWALENYSSDPIHKFFLRELLAILFLFAFYLSTKTLRSMVFGIVGKTPSSMQFSGDKSLSETEKEAMDWKERAREIIQEVNEYEKTEFND